MANYYGHMDISMKYAFLVLGKYLHEFFNLEGEYLAGKETEIITSEKRNLRMDIVYYRSGNVINNIENQTKAVDEEKLESIAEYAKFLLIYNSALVNSYIVSKIDPKYCSKEICLTETLVLRPRYLFKSQDELLKLLNMIRDKVKSNKVLSRKETMGLAMIPTLAQDDIAEKVTEEACHLITKDQSIDLPIKNEICFILDIMIDRNIKDKKKKQKLLEVLNMEERKSTIQTLIEWEYKDLIDDNKKKDNELELKDNELELKDSELELKDNELEKRDNRILDLEKQIDMIQKQKEKDEEFQKMREKLIIYEKFQNILANEELDSQTKVNILNSLILVK